MTAVPASYLASLQFVQNSSATYIPHSCYEFLENSKTIQQELHSRVLSLEAFFALYFCFFESRNYWSTFFFFFFSFWLLLTLSRKFEHLVFLQALWSTFLLTFLPSPSSIALDYTSFCQPLPSLPYHLFSLSFWCFIYPWEFSLLCFEGFFGVFFFLLFFFFSLFVYNQIPWWKHSTIKLLHNLVANKLFRHTLYNNCWSQK